MFFDTCLRDWLQQRLGLTAVLIEQETPASGLAIRQHFGRAGGDMYSGPTSTTIYSLENGPFALELSYDLHEFSGQIDAWEVTGAVPIAHFDELFDICRPKYDRHYLNANLSPRIALGGVIRRAEYKSMPWKNGTGFTEQIAISPPDAGIDAFHWRVSRARVSSDGVFSSFPGYRRVLVVTEGNGFAEPPIAPLQPFAFSGDDAVNAVLASGAITDFNVIYRDCTCDVSIVAAGKRLGMGRCDMQLLTCLRGAFTYFGTCVAAGDTIRFNTGERIDLDLTGDVLVARVRVTEK